MGVNYNTSIVTDGLVLCLDAASTKSFRGEPTVNLFSTFSSNPDNAILLGVSPISLACGSGANWSRCNYGGGTYTYSHIETKNPYGNQSLVGNLISTVTGGDYRATISNIGSSTLNRTFTFSVWIKNNGGTVSTIQMSIRTNGDANGPNASKTITSEWQRISITHTFTGTCTAQIRSYIFGLNAGANLLFYGAQLEEQAYPTPFVNGTRGTTVATGGGWADLSGNTNHGELVNGPTFNSDNLGSLVFDGVGNYINCGNSNISSIFNNSVNSNFTIMCWIKPNNIGTDQALVSQRHGDAMSLFLMSNGKITLEMDDTQNYSGTNFIFENNNWYCVAITYYNNTSSSFCEYYINGILDKNENKWDGNGIDFNNNLWIGWQSRTNYPRNPGHFFGNISQVQIYNRALSPSEVQQNFNATKSRYGI